MWPDYAAFAKPNLGHNEKWVPFHTCLGVHERFLVEEVHQRVEDSWNDWRRFCCIFIFRAHCNRDLFLHVQIPELISEAFWRDPEEAFVDEGTMEKLLLDYRRAGCKSLLTSAFRMIPPRVLKDDDANLVRSIVSRTRRLLGVAAQIWPFVRSCAEDKFDKISKLLKDIEGIGDTWTKMIMVCLDIAYPDIGLLRSQCDVGKGAVEPLRILLNLTKMPDKKLALGQLLQIVNSVNTNSSVFFWEYQKQVETIAQDRFRASPLILRQLRAAERELTAVTLEVQLCEYMQFLRTRTASARDVHTSARVRSREPSPEQAPYVSERDQSKAKQNKAKQSPSTDKVVSAAVGPCVCF